MEWYNYREVITDDIFSYIREHNYHWTDDEREEAEKKLWDNLWANDSVTGNGSGSYTFNVWEAEENLCHNWDLLGEALNEFGCGPDYLMKQGAEACDVTIRCYLLGECIAVAMDALEDEGWNDEEGGEN